MRPWRCCRSKSLLGLPAAARATPLTYHGPFQLMLRPQLHWSMLDVSDAELLQTSLYKLQPVHHQQESPHVRDIDMHLAPYAGWLR